ncbi:MAG: PRC-barrel domain-containing protein [Clostridia bacterium]|nr:PRC-barrel domain-containing protein [Clostridia bacterium]
MKRLDEIEALSCVDENSGRVIGRVGGAVISGDGKKLLGLMIRPKRFLSGERFLDFSSVSVIGDVCVLFKKDALKKRGMCPKDRLYIGAGVYGSNGRIIGWYTNAYLDEKSGLVTCLEVSIGYIDDFFEGRILISEFSCSGEGIIAMQTGRG